MKLSKPPLTDKIIQLILSNSHSTFMSDSNSKNNNSGFLKFTNGYEGICMSGGKFIKP